MLISIDAEKASDEIQHSFMLKKKTFPETGIEEHISTRIRPYLTNPQLTLYLMVKS